MREYFILTFTFTAPFILLGLFHLSSFIFHHLTQERR